MTITIVANSTKIYPIEPEVALRGSVFHEVLEVQFSAVNSDTTLDLGAIAALDATTSGPAIIKLLSQAGYINNYSIFESVRALAASTTEHVFSGTPSAPVFTFAGGGTTPTTLTLYILFRLKNDQLPFDFGI